MPNNHFITDLQIEPQIMSQWCWAAVALSVRKFYDNQFAVTQSAFVSEMLNIPQCRHIPFAFCNQRFSLQIALESLQVLEEKLDEPCAEEDIITEISNGRPIGCQLVRNGFDGHYILIKGVSGTGSSLQLEIADPFDGDYRVLSFRELLFEYRESQWEQTFFTRSNLL